MAKKIAICDDERFWRDKLTKILKSVGGDYEIDVFADDMAFLQSETIFDIVFLDIEMPGFGGVGGDIAGIDAGRAFRARSEESLIIFVSTHDELAIDTFGCRPFDFVKKNEIDIKFKKALAAERK